MPLRARWEGRGPTHLGGSFALRALKKELAERLPIFPNVSSKSTAVPTKEAQRLGRNFVVVEVAIAEGRNRHPHALPDFSDDLAPR